MIKIKKIKIILLILTFNLQANQESVFPEKVKNHIDYLSGNFDPKKYLKKVPKSISNSTTKIHYLRKEVLVAYKKMLKDFQKEYPNIKLTLISSFRSFKHQKRIWDRKFALQKKQKKTNKQTVDSILQYSSAPSTSRHHWGTDIDLNSLENSFFKTGKGKIIYEWLTKNAHKYGFCQPYNSLSKRNNKGYNLEKWHWSYFPISQKLQNIWKEKYLTKKLNLNDKFKGSKILQKKVLNYVTSINKDCVKEENFVSTH